MTLFHDKCQPWEKALALKDKEISQLKATLKELQETCGYGSPWWIKIEKTLNPSNSVLAEIFEENNL
jgi:hypothetical protein